MAILYQDSGSFYDLEVSSSLCATGSLFGTSSWSSNANTASYVTGSIYVAGNLARSASYAISASSAIDSNLLGGATRGSFISTASAGTIQTISGSLIINQDLTVFGSASIIHITSSQLNISDNLITVNTQLPSFRFGGLAVIDSGSSPLQSGSILYDSVQDEWLFVHRGTAASATTSSHFLVGPETYNNLGNEIYVPINTILKSLGNEHVSGSNISDDGINIYLYSNTQITGSLNVRSGITGSLLGTASYVTGSIFFGANQATSASYALTSSYTLNADLLDGLNSTAFITTGSATAAQSITGSLRLSGSATLELVVLGEQQITGSLNITNGIWAGSVTSSFTGSLTGSVFGTSSWANNVISAQTASYLNNLNQNLALTGSLVLSGSSTAIELKILGEQQITGSLNVSGAIWAQSVTASLLGTASYVTGSIFFGANQVTSASYAISAAYAPGGSTLTGGTDNYIARWEGTTTITTSSIFEGANKNVAINATTFDATNPEALLVSGSSINIVSGEALINNYAQLNITNNSNGAQASADIVATNNTGTETGNFVNLGINGSNYGGAIGATNEAYLYNTGSNFVIGNTTRGANSNIRFFSGNDGTSFAMTITGSVVLIQTGSITGSLLGTSSWAVSASWAPGGSGTPAFPYNGTAIITGSIIQQTGSAFFPTLNASESLSAGDFINISASFVRRAASNDTTKQAHGYVLTSVASGSAATIYYNGLYVTSSGITVGARYFLSASSNNKAVTAPTTTGQLSQEIGVGVSTTAMLVNIGPAIIT